MAIGDLVGDTFELDHLRALAGGAGRPIHRHGPALGRHSTLAARRLGRERRRRGRPDRLRPGRARCAGRGAGGGRSRHRGRDPDRRPGDPDPLERRGRATAWSSPRAKRSQPRSSSRASTRSRRSWTSSIRSTSGRRLRWRAGNIRTPGRVAKVNFALAELPRFAALAGGRGEPCRPGRSPGARPGRHGNRGRR